jgi:parvulin-like peptidyl-prolyl isomerase
MIVRRFRRVAVPLVVGVIGLGLTGCSHTTTDAATITYHDSAGDHTIHITRSEFKDQLAGLVGSAPFQDVLKKNGFKLEGDQENSTSAELSATYLSQLVQQAAIDAEFESLKLAITDQQKSDGTTSAKQSFGAPAFAAFPVSLQDTLVGQRARQAAVAAYYSAPTEAKEHALYDEFATTICPSGRMVAHILVKDLATANAVEQDLQGGAAFAAVAAARSTDTGSAQAGGSVGCLAPNAFVKEFSDAAAAAQFDVPTAPVKSQYGYHVILVTHPSYAGVRSEVVQALQQNPLIAVTLRLQEMKVWINPQFGTGKLGVNSQQGQLVYQVTPPSVPSVRSEREKAPTTTTLPKLTTPTQPTGG